MADNTVNSGNTPENLSPEEMAKRRAEITAYYEEHIPSLKIQLEYEEMLKEIEKCRAERLQAQMFITKAMAEPPAPPMPAKQAAPSTDAQKAFVKAKQAEAKAVKEAKANVKVTKKAVKDATK